MKNTNEDNVVVNINDYDRILTENVPEEISNNVKENIKLDKIIEEESLIKSKLSNQGECEVLKIEDWKYKEEEYFEIIELSIENIRNMTDKAEYNRLINSFNKTKLSNALNKSKYNYSYCIGTLNSLEYMINNTFLSNKSKEIMLYHKQCLEPYIFRYRSIAGDGNCFYRAVIFSFLEDIIMTNNIYLLKEFIIDYNEKITLTYNQTKLSKKAYEMVKNTNKNLFMEILLYLLETLENKTINEAYIVLVKSFIYCQSFDKAMIFYLKFLIYEYIYNNKDKAYSNTFCVKLGNLLSDCYQFENGEFDFNGFFEKELLVMGTMAEKLAIYIVPYVLKTNLNIIMYEYDNCEPVLFKSFPCGIDNAYTISVLYRKTHYDIYYPQNYIQNYGKYLCEFMDIQGDDDDFSPSVQSSEQYYKDVNAYEQYTNSSSSKLYCSYCKAEITTGENVFSLCNNCLKDLLDSSMINYWKHYLNYIINTYLNERKDMEIYLDQFYSRCAVNANNISIDMVSALSIIKSTVIEKIKEMKPKICIFCGNELKSNIKIYMLPCKCNICSIRCLGNYFYFFLKKDDILFKSNKISYKMFTQCICSHRWTIFDYSEMFNIFEQRYFEDYEEYEKILKKIIRDLWLKKCCFCLNKIKNYDDAYGLNIENNNFKNFKVLGVLTHACCSNCLHNVKDKNTFKCNICKHEHILKKIHKSLKDSNSCYII